MLQVETENSFQVPIETEYDKSTRNVSRRANEGKGFIKGGLSLILSCN